MRMAAIYARVSSEQQREANTIASQTTSLIEFAQERDLEVPKEWQGVLSVIGLVTSTYDFVSLSATPYFGAYSSHQHGPHPSFPVRAELRRGSKLSHSNPLDFQRIFQ